MKKKSLLLLSGLLLISLGLESCKETPRTTVTQPNQTDSGKPSTPSDKPDKPDTGGQPTNPTTPSKDRDFVDGPATTEVPKDTTPIDPDDPIYDDEIVPVWAQDEVTDPGDYNIYYTCANSKAKRTMFWLWGGTGSCGLKFTATGLTLDGAESGYTFSALYLNFNTYYYCYGSWSDTDTTSHFKVTRDSAFTGTKVKNDDGTSSNADDIDLPTPKSEGKTNIYIGEKEDGETGAFDSIEGLNEFLTSSTPAVWPKNATTEPSNYNIYYYSTGKDSLWLWGGPGNTGLGASTTKKFGEYEFNAVYLEYGFKYKRYTDWEFTTEATLKLKQTNVFTGCLLRDKAATTQSGSVDLTTIQADENGNYNIYIAENSNGAVKAFDNSDDAVTFLTPVVSTTPTPADETDPQDFNVYFTADLSNYNQGWANSRTNIYSWGGVGGENYALNNKTLASVTGIETYKFAHAYFKFGKTYSGFSDYDRTVANEFTLTGKDDIFTGYKPRQANGNANDTEVEIDKTKLVADSNGHYNLFLVANWSSESGNTLSAFYSVEEFNQHVGTTTSK